MVALVAALLFLIAFIVGLVNSVGWFSLLTVAGLFFLALAASEYVRGRVGARDRV
jgi:hypothetical protein